MVSTELSFHVTFQPAIFSPHKIFFICVWSAVQSGSIQGFRYVYNSLGFVTTVFAQMQVRNMWPLCHISFHMWCYILVGKLDAGFERYPLVCPCYHEKSQVLTITQISHQFLISASIRKENTTSFRLLNVIPKHQLSIKHIRLWSQRVISLRPYGRRKTKARNHICEKNLKSIHLHFDSPSL